MDFERDDEINGLLPKLSAEEFETLRQSIIAGEHVDSLVVLVIGGTKRVLGDGYNRLAICEGEGIPYTTRDVEVPDREAAIAWIIANQLGRRNLTAEQRAYYRGHEYLTAKKPVGNPQLAQNDPIGKPQGNTAETLARKHSVSAATIKRDASFAKSVDRIGKSDPERKREILAGKSGLTKDQIAEKKRKKRERFAAASGKLDQFGMSVPNSCRDVLFDPFLADAIETLEKASELLRLRRLMDGIRKRSHCYPCIRPDDCVGGIAGAINYCDQVADYLKAFRPMAVCPICKGLKCGRCLDSGLVPVMDCPLCDGKKCGSCKNHGKVHATVCPRCRGCCAARGDLNCTNCQGRGVIPINEALANDAIAELGEIDPDEFIEATTQEIPEQ